MCQKLYKALYIYIVSLNYLPFFFIITSILWKREGGLERFNNVPQLVSSRTQTGSQDWDCLTLKLIFFFFFFFF